MLYDSLNTLQSSLIDSFLPMVVVVTDPRKRSVTRATEGKIDLPVIRYFVIKKHFPMYVTNIFANSGILEFFLFFCMPKRKVTKEKGSTNTAQRDAPAPCHPACRPPHWPRFAPRCSCTPTRRLLWLGPNIRHWLVSRGQELESMTRPFGRGEISLWPRYGFGPALYF